MVFFSCLFRFLKSIRERSKFDLGLDWAKDGAPHSESFDTLRTPSRTEHITYFLNIYPCTFGTGYGCKQIGFASSFNLKTTGYVFQVPSVTLNSSSDFCNKFSNSLHCVIVKCWHWFPITLCKCTFSYLAYNITRNCFVPVHTWSDSDTSTT